MKKKKKQFRSELTKLLLLLLLLGILIAFGIYYNLNQEAIVDNIERDGNNSISSVANPASTYCAENKGELEIKEDEDGGQYGICIFENGKECEEWAFFKGDCDNKCFDVENKAILSLVLEKEGLDKDICNYASKIYKDDGNFYYGTLDESDFIYDLENDEVIFIGRDLPKCLLLDEKNIPIEIVNMCFDDSLNIIERFQWEEYKNEDYGISFNVPKNIDDNLYKLESFSNETDNSLSKISQNLIDYSDCSNPKTEETGEDYVILEECGKYLYVFKNKNYFHIISGADLGLLQRITNTITVK